MLKNPFRIFESILAHMFDVAKKRSMESLYVEKGYEAWNRTNSTEDADNALSLLPTRRIKLCVDAGTGTGIYAERAAAFCDKVIAVDLSERSILLARQRLAHLQNITFVQGNLRHYFRTIHTHPDLIIFGDVLYYLGDIRFRKEFENIITSAVRALAPDGMILLSTHISTGRTLEQARGYVRSFESAGMRLGREVVFDHESHSWYQAQLQKVLPKE